jgi:hypothetical protein
MIEAELKENGTELPIREPSRIMNSYVEILDFNIRQVIPYICKKMTSDFVFMACLVKRKPLIGLLK